jgi:hypothetical protein
VVAAVQVAARTRTRRGLVAGVVTALLMVLAAGSAAGWSGGNRPPSRFLTSDGTGLSQPHAVALDPAGNMYVLNSDSVTAYVATWDHPEATPFKTLTGPRTGLESPKTLAFDVAGNMYVTNDSSVTVYAAGWAGGDTAPAKTLAGPGTGLRRPGAVAFDAAGSMYVTNAPSVQTGSVTVYPSGWAGGNTAPTKTLKGPNTRLTSPTGVAFDAAGNMYVTNDNWVTVYANGWAGGNTYPIKTLEGRDTGLSLPYAVAFDAAGSMYVANNKGNSVTVYAKGWAGWNTAPIKTLQGWRTGLNYPTGMALDTAGNLYVTATNTADNTGQVLVFGVRNQTINFLPIPDARLGQRGWYAPAEASSRLPVTFTAQNPGVCTVTPQGAITLLAEGPCAIAADQAGIPGDVNPAPQVIRTFNVLPPRPGNPSAQWPTPSLGLPTQVATSGWTRLVRLPVTTNAGQQATVRAPCTPLERVRVPAGDAGAPCRVTRSASAVRVWVSGHQAVQVRVRIQAPATDDYSRYAKSRTYRVTPGQ